MRGHSRAVAASVLAVLAASAVAGCGASARRQTTTAVDGGPTASNVPATRCGTVRTAAGVPVNVEVVGHATCHDALMVERAYSRALASGKVPGNGGGAPVGIHGWICQGYATPELLATGRTSACRKQGMQIVAVLPTPSPSPS